MKEAVRRTGLIVSGSGCTTQHLQGELLCAVAFLLLYAAFSTGGVVAGSFGWHAQSNTASAGQQKDALAQSEEVKAYQAIRLNLEFVKRAALLYEFLEKYPNTKLLRPIDYQHMKMLNREEFNAYRFAKREADIEKRAMLLIEFLEKFPGTKLMEKIDLDTIKPLEDQHNAYDAAGKEVDGKKRAVLLIEFLQKYPRSALVQNVRHDYAAMMKDASLQKQYELLEFLSEHWLKVRPDDGAAYAFLAEASRGLQKYGRCGEIFETIYKMEPFPDIARETYLCYQKTENLAKNAEWAEELAKMPEFKEDYTLYFDLVMRYSQNNNVNKAAEYAERTLKAVDPDLQSDAKVKEQVRKVHRISHHIIASDLMERKNYTDAISAYKEALKDEKYGEGYYGIGLCLDNQKQIEDANLYYAMAELMGGESAPKAKARLETLYRALHNNTLVGLDKVYQKAKETLEAAAY